MKALSEIEKRIVSLLQAGDKAAIAEIYQRYSESLYGVIFQILKNEAESEDVFQESLVKIWRFGKKYDAKKGRLFTWMLNICRNTAIDRIRSRGYKEQTLIQDKDNLVHVGKRMGELGFDPAQIGLKDWVQKLDPKFMEVIQVVYFEGYSHAEAAKKLEMPLGTLKTRVRQAIMELRKWMKD